MTFRLTLQFSFLVCSSYTYFTAYASTYVCKRTYDVLLYYTWYKRSSDM